MAEMTMILSLHSENSDKFIKAAAVEAGANAREFKVVRASVIAATRHGKNPADAFLAAIDAMKPKSGLEAIVLSRADKLDQQIPAAISQKFKLPVIYDLGESCFGRAQWELLADEKKSRAIVHLGWSAKMTVIPAGAYLDEVIHTDLCPCGSMLDYLVCKHFNKPFDSGGKIAAAAKPSAALKHELMDTPFFLARVPRKITPNLFNEVYNQRAEIIAEKHNASPAQIICTYCELIANVIQKAIETLTERPHEIILTGLGAHNGYLSNRIRTLLCPSATILSDKLGWPVETFDAVCMAVAGWAKLHGIPNTLEDDQISGTVVTG